MTEAQKSIIRRLTSQFGTDFESTLDLAEEVTGGPVISLDDLSSDEISELIERLQSD